MSWPVASVGEVCEVVSGATPKTGKAEFWEGDVPWVTPKDLSELRQKHLSDTPRKITRAGLKSCSARMLPAQSVLFSSRAPIGLVAINTLPVCTNQGFKSLVPRFDLVSPDFLFWWLKAQEKHIQSKGRGATFKEVSKKIVEDLQMPLPPLAEQRRIAGILDAADALRAKRREALAQLDTLLQSTFLDMFGDPVTNPMGWEIEGFDNWLDNIDSGWSPKCLNRQALIGEWGVLKLGAVTWCEFDDSGQKALPPSLAPRPELEVAPGDLLFTRKNTHDLVAAVAYVHKVRPRLMLSDLIFRLRLKSGIEMKPAFLWQLLIQPKQRQVIQKFAGGSAGSMPNISKAKLKTLKLIKPPLDLQHRFAAIVEAVEQQKASQRAHLAELDTLFASLQSRAFRGDL